MASHNQHQMPGDYPDDNTRDEYGCTEGEYLRMVATSNDIQAPRTQTFQREGRTAPERGPGSKDGAEFHPYGHHRPHGVVPPNAFSIIGDTYPTPPIAWQNDSEAAHDDVESSWMRNDRGITSRNPFAQQQNDSSFSSRMDAQYGVSRGWHRHDPAESAYAQRSVVAISDTPSPYLANASNVATDSRPQIITRSGVLRPHAQASPREIGGPAVDDEVEDGEYSPEGEEDAEASEGQESTSKAKLTKSLKKAPKAKEDSRRGLTRTNANGEIEWLATANSEGVLAVRHDEIRAQLIAIAEAERVALGVEYEHPDEPSADLYNITSFFPKHMHWGPKREDRPDILFDWEEYRQKNPRPKCPGYMYWEEDGKRYIVLDPHGNPIKNWDIPSAIASNIPGYKLEAMRRENMSLGHKDFWARMPSQINVGTENHPIWEELGNPNSIVNMPMERFRFHAGLCSWTERKKTLIIKAGLQKLYGDKLRNNSIRTFERDLTNKEIKEIKKGDNAVFPVVGDVVPDDEKAHKKRRTKGAARTTKAKGNNERVNAPSRTRKRTSDDEDELFLGGEFLPRVKSHKRARHGRKENSIAAEVDDLVMFDDTPAIIDQEDIDRRYALRSTRREPRDPQRITRAEEVVGESSTYEEHEQVPTRRYATRKIRKAAKPHKSRKRSLREMSSEEEADYVPTQTQTDERSHSESDGADSGTSVPRVPFRRIPRAGDVGGKNRGPSWSSSSTGKKDQSDDTNDYRRTAMPISIDGRVHYATYEGVLSNDGSGALAQSQVLETVAARPQPHPFDAMMNTPWLEERNLEEEEDTPLQVHRKRVRDFLGDEEAEAYGPFTKRRRIEPPIMPHPGPPTTLGATGSLSSQMIPPPINPARADQTSSTPPGTRAQPPKSRKRKLDAELTHDSEKTFENHGSQSSNYSTVPPSNDHEVQSLIDALLPTREVYFAWTGVAAPRTDPQQSYRAQFSTILEAFEDWWGEHRPNEPLPILAGVVHLGRSVDDWIPPCKDSIYYEAFRKGHRAPQEAEGGLSDWSGPRLEDYFRMAC